MEILEEKSQKRTTKEKTNVENTQNILFEKPTENDKEEIKQLKFDMELMKKKLSIAQNNLVKYERLSAIGELSSRLSHDIRNPISIILATVTLWKRTQKDLHKEDLKKLEMINRSASKIQYMIENLLDFVRIHEPHYEEVSFKNLLEDCIHSIPDFKNIKFFLPQKDVMLRCDPYQFEVVVKNLLINSIHAIGDRSGCITIRTNQERESITITIGDSGEGIPENVVSKIFEPLFTTKKDGTGLGLVSCKNIIEAHKGTITFSNNPTTFTIVIPK